MSLNVYIFMECNNCALIRQVVVTQRTKGLVLRRVMIQVGSSIHDKFTFIVSM
jgi:hypothetical protein